MGVCENCVGFLYGGGRGLCNEAGRGRGGMLMGRFFALFVLMVAYRC